MNPKDHPNTYVATVAGAIVANMIWGLGYFGVDVPAGIAAGWVTLTVAILLRFGKRPASQAT